MSIREKFDEAGQQAAEKIMGLNDAAVKDFAANLSSLAATEAAKKANLERYGNWVSIDLPVSVENSANILDLPSMKVLMKTCEDENLKFSVFTSHSKSGNESQVYVYIDGTPYSESTCQNKLLFKTEVEKPEKKNWFQRNAPVFLGV